VKRPILHRLFSGLLALLILTTSVGLTVQRHTCRSSGHATASVIFSRPHHGCPAPKADVHRAKTQLRGACCDFSAHFHKLDASSSDLAWAKQLAAPFVAVGPLLSWQLEAPAHFWTQIRSWDASDSSSPPRGGRDLLAFACTLVV